MNVLVTGGAGYIGSAVVTELRGAGHRVVVYDNLSRGHRRAVPEGTPLVVGDTGDERALDQLFATHRIDVVAHLAGLIEAGKSMKAPDLYFRNNTVSSLTLLEAMRRHDVNRIVFSSSAAIFGNPARVPVDEDAVPDPTNPYGESKLLVERMLRWQNKAYGLRYACLRYFNVAGAMNADQGEDHRPESHLIPLVLQVALGRRRSIAILGTDYPTVDGTSVRDYVHVADVAQAHVLALDALERHDRVHYNLGNGAGVSVRQILEAARKATGHPIPTTEEPRRPGDPAILIASSERIRAELGWKPQYADLDAIIGSAWEWHKRHPEGYAD